MNTQSNKIDLSAVKTAARVMGEVSHISLGWNGRIVDLTPVMVRQIIIEGVYRQASMDSAKGGYTSEFEKDFIDRLAAGYLKESDRKKANKALEPKVGKKASIQIPSRNIILGYLRDNTPKKDTEKQANIEKFSGVSDETYDSLLSLAYAPRETITDKTLVFLDSLQIPAVIIAINAQAEEKEKAEALAKLSSKAASIEDELGL